MNKILQHPALLYASDIRDICQPLNKLNISYFAHAKIDTKGQFSAMSNNPGFHKHYLEHKYYHADIHLSGLSTTQYILWTALQCGGDSEQMVLDSEAFGIKNSFTIIEKGVNENNFYHFSTHINDTAVNQNYLTNLDLLHLFIKHFNDKVSRSKELSSSYDIKFQIEDNKADYSQQVLAAPLETRGQFLSEIVHPGAISLSRQSCNFTLRQMDILYFLVKGMSAKEIADEINLSFRTVEHHIESIKNKLGVNKRREIIEKALQIPAILKRLNLA